MIVGLSGKMGSGKDTVLERLQALYPYVFVRVSFADKLKESAAVLLGVSVDQLEYWKRSEFVRIEVVEVCAGGMGQVHARLNVREYLQRYGTEAHRGIFGDDFWVDQAMKPFRPPAAGFPSVWPLNSKGERVVPVFTDVRFENEALAIANEGGDVWRVLGDNDDTGTHASEVPLPAHLIDHTIDNTVRDDGFASLDAQLKALVEANDWIAT